jgi:hypothetical protein
MSADQSLEEIVDFNNWLGEQPHPYKIVVAGKHDLLLYKARAGEGMRHAATGISRSFCCMALNAACRVSIGMFNDRLRFIV